jgi:23S rRNA pseudouridine1911/1915/1917 synthase
VAKTNAAMAKLCRDFEARKVRKKYAALVHGTPGDQTGSFDSNVKGKDAFTSYTTGRTWKIKNNEGREGESSSNMTISEVILSPKTGRKHQLRRHLKAAGLPIVGDPKYCPRELVDEYGGQGMFLWAFSITFEHPVSGEEVSVVGQPPTIFTEFPERLSTSKEEDKPETK